MGFLSYLKDADNLVPQATLGGNEDSNFPFSNAAIANAKPARTAEGQIANQVITIDLPYPVQPTIFAAVGHNFRSTSTIVLRAGSVHDPDGTEFSAALTWRERTLYARLTLAGVFAHFSLLVDDQQNSDGFLRFVYLALGIRTDLGAGFEHGWQRQPRTLNRRVDSAVGSPNVGRNIIKARDLRIDFTKVPDADREAIDAFLTSLDKDRIPVLVVPNIAKDEVIFGRLRDDHVIQQDDDFFSSVQEITIAEDPVGFSVVDKMPVVKFGQALPSGASFTRAGSAYQKNSDLSLTLEPADVIREWWRAPGLGGWILERPGTNRWTNSTAFATGWTMDAASVSSDVIAAPDPTKTADKIVEDATLNSFHGIRRNLAGVPTDNTEQCVGAIAKAGERNWCYLLGSRKDGSITQVFVNLSTGQIGTERLWPSGAQGSHFHFADVEQLTNGWWFIRLKWDVGAGATSPIWWFRLSTGDGVNTYDGDGASGAYLWLAHYERDMPWIGSPIETAGAEVTRPEDILTVPWTFPAQMASYYLRFIDLGTLLSGGAAVAPRLFQVSGSGSLDPTIRLDSIGTAYRLVHGNGTASGSTVSKTATDQIGKLIELRGKTDKNGAAMLCYTADGLAESCGNPSAAIPYPTSYGNLLRIAGAPGGSTSLTSMLILQEFAALRADQNLQALRNL